jgi:histone deacetylase HOS3
MSSLGHPILPVVVKKTRAPAQSRVEPPKPRVRRKSPLHDTGKADPSNDGATNPPPSLASSVSLPPSQSQKSEASGIDSLTSGMKKINISLVTKVCTIPHVLMFLRCYVPLRDSF